MDHSKLKAKRLCLQGQTQHLVGACAGPTKFKLLTCSLAASVWTFDPLPLKSQARVTHAGDYSTKLSELGHSVLLVKKKKKLNPSIWVESSFHPALLFFWDSDGLGLFCFLILTQPARSKPQLLTMCPQECGIDGTIGALSCTGPREMLLAQVTGTGAYSFAAWSASCLPLQRARLACFPLHLGGCPTQQLPGSWRWGSRGGKGRPSAN